MGGNGSRSLPWSDSTERMTILTEDPTWIYLLLLGAGIVAAVAFFSTQRVLYLLAVPGVLVLAGLVWLVDFLIETDREQVERKVQELAEAVNHADFAKIESLISSRFYTPMFTSKQNLLDNARRYLDPQASRRTSFWQLDTRSVAGKSLVVDGNVSASGQYGGYNVEGWFGRIEFTFLKDADGQWRIARFVVVDSQGGEVSLRR